MAGKKKVAILGAGISGLAAVKSSLEEGLEPTCFEQNASVGGLWYYTEDFRDGQGATAFDKLTTNASKEMFAYSDFPYPSDISPFMSHFVVHRYLKSYCEKFGLNKHIQLNTKVINVRRSRDYDVTGAWEVETETERGRKSATFDYVMICSGFYKKPLVPNVQGIESFTGDIECANEYKNGVKYKHQRVLVVGNGNSSGDLAAGAADFAKEVHYSVGPGMWMMPKIGIRGVPYDYYVFRRSNYKNMALMDRIISGLCDESLDISHSGLSPATVPTMSRCMVNDEVHIHIMNGRIKVQGRLVRLGPREAQFDDGCVVHDLDTVLFATGYEISLDFLEEKLKEENGKFSLYKMVFPTHLPHNTLALIGCQEIDGPSSPILELQARLAARVFSGKHQLPSRKDMTKDADRLNDFIFSIYGRYKYLMPEFPIRDELASELGVTPSWLELIKAGPKVAYNYFYGPAFPYYERLCGPHTWSGATKAINHALEHGYYAKQPRQTHLPQIKDTSKCVFCLLAVGVLASAIAVLVKYFPEQS